MVTSHYAENITVTVVAFELHGGGEISSKVMPQVSERGQKPSHHWR